MDETARRVTDGQCSIGNEMCCRRPPAKQVSQVKDISGEERIPPSDSAVGQERVSGPVG